MEAQTNRRSLIHVAGAVIAVISLASCSSKKVAEDKPDVALSAQVSEPSSSLLATPSSGQMSSTDVKPNRTELYPTAHFAFDSAVVSKLDRALIRREAHEIKKSGNEVTVVGACDERGSEAYNLKLGMKRARAVRAALESWGVPNAKIRVQSIGKTQPIAFGHDEASWALNRRAEMRVSITSSPVASR